MIPVVLTVGALDPLGADGVLADIRTFAALGVHGAAAAALVGAPGSPLAPEQVADQIGAVRATVGLAAVKIGALASPEAMRAVAEALASCEAPVVADPSLAEREGGGDSGLAAAWRETILPIATVVTPNLAEAALLTGMPRATTLGEMQRQGEALVALGCPCAVVSGGHGQSASSVDILVSRDRPPLEMRGERLDRAGMRGLSATLASAIAAHVAHGMAVFESIHAAKLFVSTALGAAERHGAASGGGDGAQNGPLIPHQMARMWRQPAPPAGAE